MDILEKYFKNNRKVELEIFLPDKKGKIFRTDFYKNLKDSYSIFRPQNDFEFSVNQELKIILYTKDGIFVFKSVILDLNSKILQIKKPNNYKKIQRRDFLRAEIKQDFSLENENETKNFTSNNISGSGLSFYYDEIINKEKQYKITLFFKNRKIISRIKIIEIRKNLKEGLPKYRYSAKFTSLNENDKDFIIQQCVKYNIETINF